MVKEKSVAVLIEYIPISHSPDALAENRRIEHDSKIEVDTLLAMRWIKPVHRRAPGQHTVHIIARFKTATAANQVIWDGVIMPVRGYGQGSCVRSPGGALSVRSSTPGTWQLTALRRTGVAHVGESIGLLSA